MCSEPLRQGSAIYEDRLDKHTLRVKLVWLLIACALLAAGLTLVFVLRPADGWPIFLICLPLTYLCLRRLSHCYAEFRFGCSVLMYEDRLEINRGRVKQVVPMAIIHSVRESRWGPEEGRGRSYAVRLRDGSTVQLPVSNHPSLLADAIRKAAGVEDGSQLADTSVDWAIGIVSIVGSAIMLYILLRYGLG